MKLFFISFLLVLFCLPATAGNNKNESNPPATFIVSSANYNNGIVKVILTNNDTIYITPYNSDIVKVELIQPGNTPGVSDVVTLVPTAVAGSFVDSTTKFVFTFGTNKITIGKSPLKLSYYRNDTLLLADSTGFSVSGVATSTSFVLKNSEQIYGLGSHAITTQNRRGNIYSLYNQAHYGYGASAPQVDMNINIPFVVSNYVYGIYFDHFYSSTADIGSTVSNVFTYTINNGYFAYYFVFGNSYAAIMQDYTLLTGRQPLPPRWALGYIQSKYGYHTQTESVNIVNQIKNAGFPLDALVLDLYWYGGSSAMGNLNWSNSAFPTPATMMSNFLSMGVKTIVITEPYVFNSSTNYSYVYNNKLVGLKSDLSTPYVFSEWGVNSLLIDMTKPAALNWMWPYYQSRINEGVSGLWCDLGEPETHPSDMYHYTGIADKIHNRFAFYWSRFLYNEYQAVYPTTRIFNLSRSGYAGMQRYGATPWSGDIARSSFGLSLQVPILLGMGLSGESYMHSDCGGFVESATPRPKLFTRWAEFGSFSPILRFHSSDAPPEPVNYPQPYQGIVKNYINLRYSLLPYNYTLAFENSLQGLPLARPMNFYENTTALSNINDQYFWGSNFIIAPVFDTLATSRNVVLPSGNWYNFWTHAVFAGNQTINVSAPIDTMPIFVQEGSLIPTSTKTLNSTDDYISDSLTITYYPSANNSSFTMYNDDGKDPNSITNNQYETINISKSMEGNFVTDILLQSTGTYSTQPATRNLMVHVINQTFPYQVLANKKSLSQAVSMTAMDTIPGSYFYNVNTSDLYANTNWKVDTSILIQINASPVPVALPADVSYFTHINTTDSSMYYSIYPNPATNQVFVSLPNSAYQQVNTIEIFNSIGQNVLSYTPAVKNTLYILDVSKLPAGTYFVKFLNGKNSYSTPVIIK